MIYENPAELKDRIEECTGNSLRESPAIVEDSSNYVALTAGSVLRIGGRDYLIVGEAKEGRFGIGEQPKFWVKIAIDLGSGERKIIKLVFHETFNRRLGTVTVSCRRSPAKESAILDATRGDPRFMQGFSVRDTAGNVVRIIDLIKGPSFFNHLGTHDQSHYAYYYEVLPGLLRKLVDSVQSIAKLHNRNLQHGDIRSDHIFIEKGSGAYRWIDFDYAVDHPDYDIWSMGNVLTCAVARGIVTCRQAAQGDAPDQILRPSLSSEDSLVFYNYRLANLRAIYPHIDKELNALLMCFSVGANTTIASFEELAERLRIVADKAWSKRGGLQSGGLPPMM